jgi:peptidoglycan/LPS O-acetylase OafA/YrhL
LPFLSIVDATKALMLILLQMKIARAEVADIIPTIFGVLFVGSLMLVRISISRSDPRPATLALPFWVFTFVSALVSIWSAVVRRNFKWVHILNIVWLLVSLGFLYVVLRTVGAGGSDF